MKTATQSEKLDISKLDVSYNEAELVFHFLYNDKNYLASGKFSNPLDTIAYLRNGLPKEGVDAFLEKTSVRRDQLAHILHISSRQLNRYEPQQLLSAEQSNQLYELARIYTRAIDIFGDQATAEHWLNRSQTALGNKAPLEISDTSEGLRLVEDLLSQIEYGFYS